MNYSKPLPKFLTKPYTVGIVAAPFSGGQPKKGVDEGPKHLIENGLLNQLTGLGWKIDESTVTSYEPMIPTAEDLKQGSHKVVKNAGYVSRVCKDIARQVESKCRSKSLALTCGGDHSIAIGTVSGTARVYPNVGVIWVDAHADINTTMGTVSGNLHGCPVSFLLGIAGNLPEFEWCTPCIKPHQIVYIGLRDVEQDEKDLLKKHNIKAFSMHEVDKFGIGSVMEQSFAHLNKGSSDGNAVPIHLTFDVDALDPSVAPATGTPVRGGLSFREGHFICESVWETGNLVSMDIMEVNPSLSSDEYSLQQTVQVGCSLVRAGLGETLL